MENPRDVQLTIQLSALDLQTLFVCANTAFAYLTNGGQLEFNDEVPMPVQRLLINNIPLALAKIIPVYEAERERQLNSSASSAAS